MTRPKVSITFEKDTNALSQTQGMYWLRLYKNENEIDDDLFSEKEIEQLKKFAQLEGLTGRKSLHDWLKKNRPTFFKKHINDPDPNGIVGIFLKTLQEFYKEE